MRFPSGGAANLFRGRLGKALHDLAPEEYHRLFAPRASGGSPSGMADPPRPFVLRADHLNAATLPPGAEFFFDLYVFEVRQPALDVYRRAIEEVVRQGFGPPGGCALLDSVTQLGADGKPSCSTGEPLRLPLEPPSEPVHSLRIRFLTPIELKTGGSVSPPDSFATLFCRARDRISTLRSLYSAGPLAIDFQESSERARAVRTVQARFQHVEAARRSGTTGRRHPLGGFIGEAVYEGDLTEFLPILKAAVWTGIGRQTVWGKGAIEIA